MKTLYLRRTGPHSVRATPPGPTAPQPPKMMTSAKVRPPGLLAFCCAFGRHKFCDSNGLLWVNPRGGCCAVCGCEEPGISGRTHTARDRDRSCRIGGTRSGCRRSTPPDPAQPGPSCSALTHPTLLHPTLHPTHCTAPQHPAPPRSTHPTPPHPTRPCFTPQHTAPPHPTPPYRAPIRSDWGFVVNVCQCVCVCVCV